jgi:hypothetical protein
MPTILELFKSSGLDKQVKPDKDTVFEFETTGIRPRSAVELNNPLIYGNQAIRIANRSTSAVELMKQSTGGEAGDGGLIGQGLGAITGGRVTSLSQARDGINSKLGIPQLTIPTFVNNTGELQKGIEPDTMITIAKIKNDAAGTDLGRFLKQTGGGNPKTIGRQALGGGISLVKDKLREKLFGNPDSLGSNTAQPANGGWEYSSQSTYSDQIRDVKTQEDAKDKLGGTINNASSEALKNAAQLKEEGKQKIGEAAGSLKNKLKGTSNNPALDAAVEQSTLENPTPSPDLKYSETLGNYKVEYQEANTPIVDLSLVSPVYGVDRKDSGGRYGKTEYGFSDVRNNTGIYSPYNPTEGANYTAGNKASWQTTYGLDKGDTITQSPIKTRTDEETKILENQDLIPFWIKSKRSSRSAHFRSYVTGITETSSPSWSSSKFFGNPFSFYTYDGVERSVSFTLNIVCLNAGELASNWEKLEFLTAQTYPTFTSTNTGNYTNPPIVSFRLGDMYRDKVSYIESLSYSLPDAGTWETNIDGLLLPKFIDVSIAFKFIEQIGSQSTIYNIKRTKDAIQLINEQNSGGGSFTTDSITTNEAPAAPQVDESGVPITEGTEGGVNKPQQNLETGKTQPTPKEEQSGEVVTGDNTTSKAVVEVDERLEQAKQLFPNTSLYTQTFFANDLNLDLDSVKKIPSDQTYKPEFGDVYYIYNKNGYDKDWAYVVTSIGSSGGSYKGWVANDNNGYDPLGILKDFTNGTPPPQPAPIVPIDEKRRRRKKKR